MRGADTSKLKIAVLATLMGACLQAPAAEPVSETVAIEPGEVHEACIAMGSGDALDYSFTADAELEFNVHYHAGDDVRFPVEAHAAAAEDGIFFAPVDQDYCLMWTNHGATAVPLSLEYTHSPDAPPPPSL